MNKIQKVIDSLEATYNININDLVNGYGNMLTLEKLAVKHSTTIHTIRTCLMALQLRRKKSHRALDLSLFRAALADSRGEAVNVAFDTEQEIKELYRQLDAKDTALQKARVELNRYRTHSRTSSRTEHIFDSLTSAVEKVLETRKGKLFSRVCAAPSTEITQESKEGLVVIIGDTHFGEVVKPNEVPNNEFNYNLAFARLDVFIDAIITYPRQSSIISVVNLKDTIRGIIHGGLYTSEDSFIESILRAVDFEVYMYSLLAEVYSTVNVYSTGSNHDRLTENIPTNNKNIDYGRLIDKLVLRILKSQGTTNVNIIHNDYGYNMFSLNGANIVAFHGDTLRKFNVSNADQRALLQDHCMSLIGKPYRHSINGHNHNAAVCANQYGGISIQNGSLVGSNSYGVTNGMRNITPSQSICFVEESGSIEDLKILDLSSVSVENITDL